MEGVNSVKMKILEGRSQPPRPQDLLQARQQKNKHKGFPDSEKDAWILQETGDYGRVSWRPWRKLCLFLPLVNTHTPDCLGGVKTKLRKTEPHFLKTR